MAERTPVTPRQDRRAGQMARPTAATARRTAPRRAARARAAARAARTTAVHTCFVTIRSDAWNANATTIVPSRQRTASKARAWGAAPQRARRTRECQIVRRPRARAGRRMTSVTRGAATRTRVRPAARVTERQAHAPRARAMRTAPAAFARLREGHVSSAPPMRRAMGRSPDAACSPARARRARRTPIADTQPPSAIPRRSRVASARCRSMLERTGASARRGRRRGPRSRPRA